MKEIFKIAVSLENTIQYQLLERFNLKKTLRILSWVQRFTINCNIKERKKRSKGLLTTKRTDPQLTKMIRDNQSRSELDPAFKEIKEVLNLKKNKQGLYECHGRIIGDYPIFVLRKTLLAEKMVAWTHYQTLHGGVNLTMTKIQRRCSIPNLRQLTKRIIRTCHGCRRFRTTVYVAKIPGQLPPDRTNGRQSFQVIGLELERTVQHLYPMELHCDRKYNDCIEKNEVNDDDQEEEPRRSKRTAAAIAKIKIRDKIEDQQGAPTVE